MNGTLLVRPNLGKCFVCGKAADLNRRPFSFNNAIKVLKVNVNEIRKAAFQDGNESDIQVDTCLDCRKLLLDLQILNLKKRQINCLFNSVKVKLEQSLRSTVDQGDDDLNGGSVRMSGSTEAKVFGDLLRQKTWEKCEPARFLPHNLEVLRRRHLKMEDKVDRSVQTNLFGGLTKNTEVYFSNFSLESFSDDESEESGEDSGIEEVLESLDNLHITLTSPPEPTSTENEGDMNDANPQIEPSAMNEYFEMEEPLVAGPLSGASEAVDDSNEDCQYQEGSTGMLATCEITNINGSTLEWGTCETSNLASFEEQPVSASPVNSAIEVSPHLGGAAALEGIIEFLQPTLQDTVSQFPANKVASTSVDNAILGERRLQRFSSGPTKKSYTSSVPASTSLSIFTENHFNVQNASQHVVNFLPFTLNCGGLVVPGLVPQLYYQRYLSYYNRILHIMALEQQKTTACPAFPQDTDQSTFNQETASNSENLESSSE